MTEFKSRLSAEYPEYAQWRYEQALANSRIEGIEPDPEFEKFLNDCLEQGIPEEEILKEYIEMVKQKIKEQKNS